ncbi:MAG TPA: ABC transporter transmembrane domain-containing protein, partial [Chloroflexota bacterium]
MRNDFDGQLPTGRRELAPVVALGALGTVATIAQMALLSAVLGRALLGHQHISQVLPSLLFLLGVIVLRALLAWGEEAGAQLAALRLTGDLREQVFAHLLQLGPAYVQRERSGDLATAATEGIDRLTPYYQRYVPLQSLSLIVPALIILFLTRVDLLASLLLLGTAPVIPLLMVLIGSYSQTHVQRHWLALSRVGAQFLDTLQGLPTLLLFGAGAAAGEQVRAASTALQERTMRVLRVAFLSGMVLDITTGMAIGLVAVLVAVQLLAGHLPFQSALLVLLLAPECYRPLRELGVQRHTAMEGKAAGQRLVEILQARVPVTPVYTAHPSDQLLCSQNGGERSSHGPVTVVFSGVSYRYPDGHHVGERDERWEGAPTSGFPPARPVHIGAGRMPALRPRTEGAIVTGKSARPAVSGVT